MKYGHGYVNKNDTIRLAGHCDAGCKMAIDSMDQIQPLCNR